MSKEERQPTGRDFRTQRLVSVTQIVSDGRDSVEDERVSLWQDLFIIARTIDGNLIRDSGGNSYWPELAADRQMTLLVSVASCGVVLPPAKNRNQEALPFLFLFLVLFLIYLH